MERQKETEPDNERRCQRQRDTQNGREREAEERGEKKSSVTNTDTGSV